MFIKDFLTETDPIDMDAFRRKKDGMTKVPDNLKFKGAAAKQRQERGDPPATINDLARDIILRNLDKVFSGQPLPDEDRKQLNTILRAGDFFTSMKLHEFVRKVLQLYKETHKITIDKVEADPRKAYLHDDPSYTKWHLRIGKWHHNEKRDHFEEIEKKYFDSQDELDLYVLKNYLIDVDKWPEDKKKELERFIDHLAKPTNEEPEKPFDPMQRPMWNDKPDENQLIPYVERLLRKYEFQSDKGYGLWFATMDYEAGKPDCKITFSNKNAAQRVLQFPSVQALEKWVLDHQEGLALWYKRQETVQHTDDMIIKVVERRLINLLRKKLAGGDLTQIKTEADYLKDNVIWRIQNKKVEDFLWDMANNMQHEYLMNNDYYLEYIPLRVKELLAKQN